MEQLVKFVHNHAPTDRKASTLEMLVRCCLEYYELSDRQRAQLGAEDLYTTTRIKIWIRHDDLLPEAVRVDFSQLLSAAAYRAAIEGEINARHDRLKHKRIFKMQEA